MRTIYFQFFVDDDAGEVDAFFELSGKRLVYIDSWSRNDAEYRPEYMKSLFSYLGVDVKPLPEKYKKKALAFVLGEI